MDIFGDLEKRLEQQIGLCEYGKMQPMGTGQIHLSIAEVKAYGHWPSFALAIAKVKIDL